MKKTNSSIGQAKTVLVFNDGNKKKAVISTVVVRVLDGKDEPRVKFSGPVSFSANTKKHLTDTVVPIAEMVLGYVGIAGKGYEITVANIGAASIFEVGIKISGYSLDMPVFLAILSARLQIPLSDDAVFTGHIGSTGGDIKMVSAIPAKVDAIMGVDFINTLFCPSPHHDQSLTSLTPDKKSRITGALSKAKGKVQVHEVIDISELVEKAFSKEDVVISSLKQGFYQRSVPELQKGSISSKAANFFIKNNDNRFWQTLERSLFQNKSKLVKNFLLTFANFHIERKIYPKKFGSKLLHLIISLPPETRRRNLLYPLIPISTCVQLCQQAKKKDNDDVLDLFKAISGNFLTNPQKNLFQQKIDHSKTDNPIYATISDILSEISQDALIVSVGGKIDGARSTYSISSTVIDSYEHFLEVIRSFYLHILRHTNEVSLSYELDSIGAESIALVERAFSKQGGFKAALAEAKHGHNGGLRRVLDSMTDHYKQEQMEKHVQQVLKSALDPLDWDGKVDLMKELMHRLKPHLPQEILLQPVSRYADQWETISHVYVKSIDQMTALFRLF